MKLRNKKTGEIKDACEVLDMKQEDGVLYKYYSLAELNEEWEDYEEPKVFYYIKSNGYIVKDNDTITNDFADDLKSIGNYFKTKEEAEQAVESLMAWKRLKDAGFKLTSWYGGSKTISYDFEGKPENYIPLIESVDLDLLFGGEE